MKKRILSFCLIMALLSTLFAFPVGVMANDEARYIVLVLDTSQGITYHSDGQDIYTAESPIEYVKASANQFVTNTLQSANSNQYIAIVSYDMTPKVLCNFTTNTTDLTNAINSMKEYTEYGTNIASALETANNLMSNVTGEKHVILYTTGSSNQGSYLQSGKYDSSVTGNEWVNMSTDIELYKYANHAHTIADKTKENAKLYTVGVFQIVEDMPKEGQDVVVFKKMFAKDLASSEDYFYSVDSLEQLNSAFETVAEDIQLNPSIWAKGEIAEAKDLGLIPETLNEKDLSKKITRGEFAAVALELYESLSGKTIRFASSPFMDIKGNANEESIKKAYDLNIVAGVSSTEFQPDSKISREDLAAMLCRAIKKYKFEDWSLAADQDYYLDSEGVKKYADDADISGYAKPSVYYLTKMGILSGISKTHFAPKNTTTEQEAQGYATATREQAIALALRIFKISELLNVSRADTSWKNAYVKFLKMNQSFDAGPISYKKGKGRFALAYLDNDNIPELLIISQNTDSSLIYTYKNKKVTSFSTYYGGTDVPSYSYKKIKYIEKGNKMLVDWSESNIVNKLLLVKPDFEDTSLMLCFETAIVDGTTYYCNEYDMKRLSEENYTYIEDFVNHEVSESEYHEYLNKYGIADESVFKSITENDVHLITPDVIDKVLAN